VVHQGRGVVQGKTLQEMQGPQGGGEGRVVEVGDRVETTGPAFQANIGYTRVPISASEPTYLGFDKLTGMYSHSLMFMTTRWE